MEVWSTLLLSNKWNPLTCMYVDIVSCVWMCLCTCVHVEFKENLRNTIDLEHSIYIVWVASKPLESSYFYPPKSANTCAPDISVGSRDSTIVPDKHFTKHTISLAILESLVCLRHHSQCYSHFFLMEEYIQKLLEFIHEDINTKVLIGFTKGHTAWWIYIV